MLMRSLQSSTKNTNKFWIYFKINLEFSFAHITFAYQLKTTTKMENILSQIPKEVIERYGIKVEKGILTLYTQPKEMLGVFSFSNPEIKVKENVAVVQLIDTAHLCTY